MEKGMIQIYYGEGRGKSTAALGNALRKADSGKTGGTTGVFTEAGAGD